MEAARQLKNGFIGLLLLTVPWPLLAQDLIQSIGSAVEPLTEPAGTASVVDMGGGSGESGPDFLLGSGDAGELVDIDTIPADELMGLGGSDQEVFLLGAPAQQAPEGGGENTRESEAGEEDDLYGIASRLCQDDDGDGVCNQEDYCEGTPEGSIVMPNGCHLTREAPLELVGVFFDFNGYTLRPESYEILDRVVALLRQQDDVIVEVGGHTDSLGREEINLELSRKRAKAVHDYLIAKGIESYRLGYRGYGSSQPVAPNTIGDNIDYPEGRARNRRVELRVTGDLATLKRRRR